MSSYICSRRHFDSIAKGVIRLSQSGDFYFSRKLEISLREFNGTHHNSEKRTDELIVILVDELAALQVRCVCHQNIIADNVENVIAEQLEVMQIKTTNPLDLRPIPLYRVINCALYQVETKHLTKVRPLSPVEEVALNFFETFNAELAEYIVERLPAYLTAKWSIK